MTQRVETCRPKMVFYVINCYALTDILYYACYGELSPVRQCAFHKMAEFLNR